MALPCEACALLLVVLDPPDAAPPYELPAPLDEPLVAALPDELPLAPPLFPLAPPLQAAIIEAPVAVTLRAAPSRMKFLRETFSFNGSLLVCIAAFNPHRAFIRMNGEAGFPCEPGKRNK